MNNVNDLFNKNSERKIPLYPEEAYSPQNNIQQGENQQKESQSKDSNPMQNALLPLLLSAMQGGGDNNDMMSKLLSTMGGNGDQSQMIQALTSSLNKNKKKENTVKTVSPTEKAFPRNEYLS